MEKKIQSAMEYLMTYGWAILIIAVVLAVLFSLGITNPLFFAPKATAGGCQVLRPNGPGTTSFISLEGGGLCKEIPESVAYLTDVQQYYIIANILGEGSLPSGTTSLSIFAWIKIPSSDNIPWQRVVSYGTESCTGESAGLEINGNGVTGSVAYDSECGPSAWSQDINVNDNNWHFIGFSMPNGGNSATVTLYFDGVAVPHAGTNPGITDVRPEYIILGGGPVPEAEQSINGEIANIQIYNTTINAASVKALYREGIGGAPIDLQNLVGWWPLNGNANDYSGNNNDGIATNVIWSGTWWQDYTQP